MRWPWQLSVADQAERYGKVMSVLNERVFDGWLESKDPDAIIGTAFDPGGCVVVKSVLETARVRTSIKREKMSIEGIRQEIRYEDLPKENKWVGPFVVGVDEAFRGKKPVTTRQAREIFDRVRIGRLEPASFSSG